MPRLSRQCTALASLAALGLVGAGLSVAGPAQAASGRRVVSPASSWTAHAGNAALLPSNASVHLKVWLAARNTAALQKLAAAVSDPRSATYGHYLTADQYRSSYAPTAAQVDAVRSWAKSVGLSVEDVGADNHFVAVAGSGATIDSAFGAAERQFTVNGVTVLGPTRSVSVPTSLGASVLAVTGFDTLAHQVHNNAAGGSSEPAAPGGNNGHRVALGPPAGFVNAGPCSSYYNQKTATDQPAFEGAHLPYAVCGYTPSQLRSVYGVSASGKTGRGVTVAITDAFASPTLRNDANTYAARHGDAAFRTGQFTSHDVRGYDPQRVADCGGNGWYGEQTLDVEAVHGIAPDANVAYYGAASCYDDDFMAALANVVSDNQASLVSNSWGEPSHVVIDGVSYDTYDSALLDAYDSIFTQGAVQGIGFYFSSGDGGDENANYGVVQSDLPASSPNVTAVGGTSLAVDATGARQFETGWGTHKWSLTKGDWTGGAFLYGAGGGYSDAYPRPAYQTPSIVTTGAGRAVPDIAMDADPTTGMLVGETQAFAAPNVWGKGTHYGEYRIGGTSLASPLTAGLNAVAQQGRSARIGFANPLIYSLDPAVFFDVTPQGDRGNVRVDYVNGYNGGDGLKVSVRTFDEDSSLTTGDGWDDVTGRGTPTPAYIAAMGD